jgi:hypothetical protein
MGRVPPSEYTDKPRGGFSQIMEKLPDRTLLTSTRDDPNATHDDIELSPTLSDTQKLHLLEETMKARNSKSYYIFGSLLSTIGLIFSIVSMTSCSFAIVNWAIDGSTVAYQSTITHLGLFRWYNPKTSTCWAYNPTDDRFFYVDKAAQGLATSAVVFGGCAACIFGFVLLGNLISKCCGGRNNNNTNNNNNKSNCCSKYNLNSTNNSITFFILSGLTLLASICQICTLTYFNMKNVTEYEVTCNASADSSCVQGAGAHYTIIAFVMYLFGSSIFGFAGLGCWIVEMEKKKREGGRGNGGGEDDDEEEEDNLPPPPPPAYPPPAALINGSSNGGGRGGSSGGQQVIEGGPPPPSKSSEQPTSRQQDDVSAAPSTFSARAYVSHGNGHDEMQSV